MSLGRREFLTACLGASAALVACKDRAPELRFSGGLLGQHVDRGHRIRAGFRPKPVRREKVGIAIIGAGMAGLSAGWRLQKKGQLDHAIFELEDCAGGTSASGRNSISAYPWGAHYVPVPLPGETLLSELLTDMKVISGRDNNGRPIVAEELLCRAPQERLFIGGQWHDGLYPRTAASKEDLRQLHAFEAEIERFVSLQGDHQQRAFRIPSAASDRSPELDALDKISMAEFLDQRGWKSPRLRWYVEYGCRDDYGCTLANTSAWAGIFYFAARVEKAGARAAEFITWPSGNGAIVSHLESLSGPRLRKGVVILDVIPRGNGVELLAWGAARSEAFAIDAEHAVFALPQYLARHLISPLREKPEPARDIFTYSPWIVANISLKIRPEENSFPLAWDNVVYDSKSLGYVVATHQTGKDYGDTVFTYYLPLTDPDPRAARQLLLSADWKHWADLIVADLRRCHPDIAGCISNIDIWRWGHAMVRPVPGLIRGGALEQARAPIGRLQFANTDLSGMALFEEAQHWGVKAADRILALGTAGQ